MTRDTTLAVYREGAARVKSKIGCWLADGYMAFLCVVHYGFRSNSQAQAIWMRDSRGGGMIAKEMHYQPLHALRWLLSWLTIGSASCSEMR